MNRSSMNRFCIRGAAYGAMMLLFSATLSAQLPPTLQWKKVVINPMSDFEASGVADLNKDGNLDIICGDKYYAGPDWKPVEICPIKNDGGYRIDFANVPMDVNGDGWMDIVSCNWHAQSVTWRENPGAKGGVWTEREVDKPGNMETAVAMDIDGDGKLDFLPDVQQQTKWYRVEGNKLVGHVASPTVGGHGIGAGDINGDGRVDILKPGGWLEAPEDRVKGEWIWHPEWNMGAAGIEIVAHDFTADGLTDVFWGMGHDYGLFWLEQTRETDPAKKWIKHEIDKDWSQAHAVVVIDIDGDGRQDIVTGKRRYAHNGHDPGGNDPAVMWVYAFDRYANTFRRVSIDQAPAAKKEDLDAIDAAGGDPSEVIYKKARLHGPGMGLAPTVIDIDGDGDLDLVAPGKSGLFLYLQEKGGATPAKDAVNQFKLPEGFEIKVFASEPDIRKPIALTFDERGRMIIAEAAEYPLGPRKGEAPQDTVKILEDTDQDGDADKITVFADGLTIPDAVAAGHGGIYIAEAPNLWFMQDTDGDGRADSKKKVLTNFGTQDSHHNVHGLQWSPEGRLMMNQGCSTTSKIRALGTDGIEKEWDLKEGDFFSCWPDGTGFQIDFKGFTNSWGYDWDDWGNWVCNDNEGPHLIHLIDGADYGYSLTNRHDGKPGTLPPMETDHAQHHGYLVQTGLTVYSGTAFPPEYNGNIIQGAANMHKLIRDIPDENGASLFAEMAEDLCSTEDAWHRPLALAIGPDGALYMLDWYNEILAHVEHPLDSPRRDKTHGRIYRIQWKGAPKFTPPDLTQARGDELVANLRSDNKWLRRTSQRVLAWRIAKGDEPLSLVTDIFGQKESPRTIAHAIWTMMEVRGGKSDWAHEETMRLTLRRAMDDPDKRIRRVALRMARQIPWPEKGVITRALELADDPNDFVKFEAARLLAQFEDALPVEAISRLVARAQWDDPYLAFAFKSAMVPNIDALVNEAFTIGARGMNEDQEHLVSALIQLSDPRTEPILIAMLRLPELKPHLAEELLAGLRSSSSPEVSRSLVAFLGRRSDLPAALVRPILDNMRHHPPTGEDREAAVAAVSALARERDDALRRDVFLTAASLRADETIPAMIAALDSSDAKVAEAATLALGEMGSAKGSEEIVKRIGKSEGRARWAGVRALSQVQANSTEVEHYLDALADPDTARDAIIGLRREAEKQPQDGRSEKLLANVMERVAADRASFGTDTTNRLREWIEKSGGEKKSAYLAQLTANEGVLRDWKIIGPFPNPETKGHAAVYPPETELKDDAAYEYQGQTLRWMPRRADDQWGIVQLMDLQPNDHAVAFGWTTFESETERNGMLYCGSDDSIKVWVNGELVHDNLIDRGLTVDQDQASVKLRAGTNTILVKCGQNGGGWNFHARIGVLPVAVERDPENLEVRAMHMQGNAAAGEKIFYGTVGCARCHAIGDKGGRVGPDLTFLARYNPKSHIVRSLLKPSEEIAEGFGGVTLVMNEGGDLEGYIARETPTEVTLVKADGVSVLVRKDQIKERRSRSASGMPDDIATHLKPGEVVDLVAFLEERR